MALGVGHQLAKLEDLTGGAQLIRVNGAELHRASARTTQPADQVLDRYLTRLAHEVALPSTTYVVHPGVLDVLAWLKDKPAVAIGLGTGNVKLGAHAKLARGALVEPFAFGGFGCDAEDRTELLRIGATRGAEALGVPLAECRVVVIGDTPKDVAAAHGIGAECIGVGTGGFEPDALRDLGARAFATLDEDGVREALFSA